MKTIKKQSSIKNTNEEKKGRTDGQILKEDKEEKTYLKTSWIIAIIEREYKKIFFGQGIMINEKGKERLIYFKREIYIKQTIKETSKTEEKGYYTETFYNNEDDLKHTFIISKLIYGSNANYFYFTTKWK